MLQYLFHDCATDVSLSDLDITNISRDDIKEVLNNKSHDPYTVLNICDKLAMRDEVNTILNSRTQPPIAYDALIINHSLSDTGLLRLYATTNAYNPLYGCVRFRTAWICGGNDIIRTGYNILRNATLNGLRVTDISIDDQRTTIDDIKCCTSLTKLEIFNHNHKITTCEQFSGSLKILTVSHVLYGSGYLSRTGLCQCSIIEELYMSGNFDISSCAPFAKSLKVLDACRTCCTINDEGLATCTSITELNARDNYRITTCAPFAKSLKILNATGACGINDLGIKLCIFITELCADNNHKITTCEPFAKSLTKLDAAENCGIDNNGIKSCISITTLNAMNNPKITTCIPFARSLTYLDASGTCGICDTGLIMCHAIATLKIMGNRKITTCASFAKSLKKLYMFSENIDTEHVFSLCGCRTTIYRDTCGILRHTDIIAMRGHWLRIKN